MPASVPAHRPTIIWFTRDLRLHDHAALHAACASGRKVIACYILDERIGGAWAMGAASRWWLHHSLTSLTRDLAKAGVRLTLRRGETAAEITRLVAESAAAEIHTAQPIELAERAMVDALEPALAACGCALHRHWTTLLFDPETLRTGAGGPYGVYTPFAKACFARGVAEDIIPAPKHIDAAPSPASDDLAGWELLPVRPDWAGGLRESWEPGESAAHRNLHDFIDSAIADYKDARDIPGIDGVSRLSPALHWGEISARAVWHAASQYEGQGPRHFLSELLWREFSAHMLWHHPALPDEPLRAQFNAMRWRDDAAGLRAWRRGQTGIPIVDAGMRQLWTTGWQHNRVRMITASFLIKHLLIDWRAGEAWFWDTLVDADLASNSANWQWVAGCGADASPFFRVFNPWLQGQKFDSDGAFVRRYVPELGGLDAKYIHAPEQAPSEMLARAGIVLGETYPHPIIDLAEGRARALDAFRHVTDKIPA